MKNIGLVSISFRNRTAEEIIEAVKNAGLNAIEWGGDVHVPHGNVSRARGNTGVMRKRWYFPFPNTDPTISSVKVSRRFGRTYEILPVPSARR